MGRLVTKALRDGFVVPLPLSVHMLSAALGEDLPLSALPQPGDGWDGEFVGAAANFATKLRAKCTDVTDDEQRARIYKEESEMPGWAGEFLHREGAAAKCSFAVYAENCSFLEMGSNGVSLCDEGSDRDLDASCLDEFVELAAQWWLRDGIRPQVEAFRRGIEDVCSSPAIWAFEPEELRDLLCGCGANWSREELLEHLRPAGGYNKSSAPFVMLVEELACMPLDRRGRFVEFVTGCPRLPPSGLAAAQIKVVPLAEERDTLPRSHTCSNQLKLPQYSSAEVFARMFNMALDNAQGMADE